MDTIDVGGASAGGRPGMPAITTVDESGASLEDTGYESTQQPAKHSAAVNEKVQRSVQSTPIGRAHAAYPDTHPANRDDIELGVDGGLILPAGHSSPMRKPLGDIREGYVTGSRDNPVNARAGVTSPESIDESLAELQAELEHVPSKQDMQAAQDALKLTAHDEQGAPLIEVLFHLDIGTVASYHSKVVEQGRWLIFIDDNTLPAKQKFIPKPGDDKSPLNVTITGSDKVQLERRVLPLGINFAVDNYDFFVTLLVPTEE